MENQIYKLECICLNQQRQLANNRFCMECYSKRKNTITQFSDGQVQYSVRSIIALQKKSLHTEFKQIEFELEKLESIQDKILNELSIIKDSLRQSQSNISNKLSELGMISEQAIKEIHVKDYQNLCLQQLVKNHQFLKCHLNQDMIVKNLQKDLDELHQNLLNIQLSILPQMLIKNQEIEFDTHESSKSSKQNQNYDLVSIVKHRGLVTAAQISPKKTFLASSSQDILIVWDIIKDSNFYQYQSDSIIISICFSKCENFIYFGDKMGRIGTLNLTNFKLLFMKIHESLTFHIVQKQDQQLISLSPGQQKKIIISDQKNKKIILQIPHESGAPSNFDYSDKQNAIIGTDFLNEICIWDAQTGKKIIKDDTIFTQAGYIMVCLNDEQNKLIATKGPEIKIIRINFEERIFEIITSLNEGYDKILNISWVKNDDYYLCCFQNYLKLHRSNDHLDSISYPIQNQGYLMGKQTPDLEYLVTIGEKKTVHLYLIIFLNYLFLILGNRDSTYFFFYLDILLVQKYFFTAFYQQLKNKYIQFKLSLKFKLNYFKFIEQQIDNLYQFLNIMNLIKNLISSKAIIPVQESVVQNEVLALYRQILKQIPKTYQRKLQRVQKHQEAKWLFKQHKDEIDQEMIEYLKKVGYDVLLKMKNHETLPQFYPNPLWNNIYEIDYIIG
ncbi:hypothetical protein pb186bvf_000438 [Paramecium bursaria]